MKSLAEIFSADPIEYPDGFDFYAHHVVLAAVGRERVEQFLKWKDQDLDPFVWLGVLAEEFGELSQSLLHDRFGGSAAGTSLEELVQVAAVAVQWLEVYAKRHLDSLTPARAKTHKDYKLIEKIVNITVNEQKQNTGIYQASDGYELRDWIESMIKDGKFVRNVVQISPFGSGDPEVVGRYRCDWLIIYEEMEPEGQ